MSVDLKYTARLITETSQWQTGMERAANSTKKVSAAVKSGVRDIDTYADRMDKAGKKAQDVGDKLTKRVTLPVIAAGFGMVKAASDVGEAVDATSVIFDDNAASIESWADTAADKMGMSKRAALEAANTFGGMAAGMKLSSDTAEEMSKTLTQVGVDLGSLRNIESAEVFEKIRAGLAGEAEPLRQFGVDLSAAATEAKAVELGLVGMNGEITESNKVMARYQIIQEDLAYAQGNFADTQDSLANSTRTVKAQFEDAAAELGEELIPVALDAVDVARDLVGWFGELDQGSRRLVLQMAGIAAAAGPVTSALGGISRGAAGAIRMTRSMLGLSASVGAVGLAAAAAGALYVKFKANQAEAAAEVDNYADSIDAATSSLTEHTRAVARDNLMKSDALQVGRDLGISADVLVDAVMGEAAALDAVQSRLEHVAELHEANVMGTDDFTYSTGDLMVAAVQLSTALGIQTDRLREGITAAREAAIVDAELEGQYFDTAHAVAAGLDPAIANLLISHQDAAEAAAEHDGAVGDLGDAAEGAAGDLQTLTEAVDAHMEAQRAATDPVFNAVRAARQLADAQGDVAEAQQAIADGEGSVAELDEALWAAVGAAEDLDFALIEAGDAGDTAVGRFRELARQAGLSDEQIDRVLSTVRETEATAREAFRDSLWHIDADVDMSELSALEQRLSRIFGRPYVVDVKNTYTPVQYASNRPRALGGAAMAGMAHRVGERGPEVFVPDVSGRIIPTSQLTSTGTRQQPPQQVIHDNRQYTAQLVDTDRQTALIELRKMSLRFD